MRHVPTWAGSLSLTPPPGTGWPGPGVHFLIIPAGAPCGANHVCTMKNNNFKKTLAAFEAQQISAAQQVKLKGGTDGDGGGGVIGNEEIILG